MKKNYFFGLLFFFIVIVNAQKDQDLFEMNTRKNVVWIFNKYDGAKSDLVNKFSNVSEWTVPSLMNKFTIENNKFKFHLDDSKFVLKEKKVPNDMMKQLFVVNNTLDFSKFSELAKLNMSDADVTQFSASSVGVNGSAERKFYKNILNSNLIAVANVQDLHSQEVEYNRIDEQNRKRAADDAKNDKIKPENKYVFNPVNRTHTGYYAKIVVNVFKIDLSSEEKVALFEQNVFKEGLSIEDQINLLKNYSFEIVGSGATSSVVKSVLLKETAIKQKTQDEYYIQNILNSGQFAGFLDAAIGEKDEMKIKSTVYDVSPNITSKIGTKEGLTINRRFFVYEKVQDKDGNIKPNRKGAIRVKGNPSNNNGIATGDTKPSQFYQIQGGKIDKGMLLVEKRSNTSLGLAYGSNDINFYIDSYLPSTALKLFAELGIESNLWNKLHSTTHEKEFKLSTTSLSLGLMQDFHFLKSMYFAPFIGVYYEMTKSNDEDLNVFFNFDIDEDSEVKDMGNSKITFNIGSSIGFYLSPNVRLYGSLNYAPAKYDAQSELTIGNYFEKFERKNIRSKVGLNISL